MSLSSQLKDRKDLQIQREKELIENWQQMPYFIKCCSTMEYVVDDHEGIFVLKSVYDKLPVIATTYLEIVQNDHTTPFPITFCPFCGTKIEYV